MFPATQQTIVSLGLLALGVYFTVQLIRGLWGYQRYSLSSTPGSSVRCTTCTGWP